MSERARSRFRRAAKRHKCDQCGGEITPGHRYLDSQIPPEYEYGATGHWYSLKSCQFCVDKHGLRPSHPSAAEAMRGTP